jgi:hypothetical protein
LSDTVNKKKLSLLNLITSQHIDNCALDAPNHRNRNTALNISKTNECSCRIVDFADGAADPIDFPIAPKVANDRLLKQTGMNAQQVS